MSARRIGAAVVLLGAALAPAVVLGPPAPALAAPAPIHTLTVTGTGVDSYPAFSPGIERYAVTTTSATGGTLTVHAGTTDPDGVVRVDGRVAVGGEATVTGLGSGDEVSVFIEDSGGVAVHSLFYLPAGFPKLEVPVHQPGLAPGQVGLTLSRIGLSPSDRFVTAVDRNGVPAHVLVADDAYDLKDQPDGTITYQAPTTTPGRTGDMLVSLDEQWRPVAAYETVGLTDTDPHDSLLLPDGTRWQQAYEPDGHGKLDSVIQEIGPDGQELFRWSSTGLQDESVVPAPFAGGPWDYAHLNSFQLLPDGDLLASFRHLSAVLRIATYAHDGYTPGEVEWRLGGRDSDFTFVDDPYGGPCAQHTASLLPNGHVLVFDDGSGPVAGNLCVDQADAHGPTVARPQSRVAEYALDPAAGTATLVWSYAPPGWYTWFMGSARRLANGDTLVGWADETRALSTEVAPDGTLLWQLRAVDADAIFPPYQPYRASLMRGRDTEPPVVTVAGPADGTHVVYGAPLVVDFGCTDRGGSSLQACGGGARPGDLLDTSVPGTHTVRLTGTDGAGNATTVTRTYTVDATYLPRFSDSRVRRVVRHRAVTAVVRLGNAGTAPDSLVVSGTRATPLRLAYVVDGVDVTRAVRAGGYRTPVLAPGQSVELGLVVRRARTTRPGARAKVYVHARSSGDPALDAELRVRLRARGAP
jgi:hypothetical protein